MKFKDKLLLQLVFLFLLFSTNLVFAQQKIVLLTSINTQEINQVFRKSHYKNYVKNLERSFLKQFLYSKYNIEVIHNANQFDLWKVLHDPLNIAVFWLSHAGASRSFSEISHFINTHKIMDSNHFEITPIFDKIHPNLRFLAVIGSFSKEVIDQLPQASQDLKHPTHPYLRIFTFNKKIDAQKGLKQAISAAKKVLNIPEIRMGYASQCHLIPGYSININRKFLLPEYIIRKKLDTFPIQPSVRLMSGQKVLGTFPEGKGNESTQNQVFFIPKEGRELPNLRIDSGENSKVQMNRSLVETLDLGKLKITLNDESGESFDPWTIWTTSNGKPIGIFSHYYKLQQEKLQQMDLASQEISKSEFVCDPMPSYE